LSFHRARRFAGLIRRFDLVPFADLADWYARTPGSIQRNEEVRLQTIKDLENAVMRGEFGPATKPGVVYLPPYALDRSPGRRSPTLRPTGPQIAVMRNLYGMSMGENLWAPRGACRQWAKVRELQLPPWLLRVKAAAPPSRRQPKKQISVDRVVAFMQQLARARKRPIGRDEAIDAACSRKGLNCDRQTARAAYQSLDQELRNPPHRPRKVDAISRP
jgi:hypothetical protein